MSLIFDRTARKNKVTRELYYSKYRYTQFQFLGDGSVTVWNNSEVWLIDVNKFINTFGSVVCKECSKIYPDGRVT